jgi:hypothetical protein
MILGSNNMRVYAPGLSCTVKTRICEQENKDSVLHIQANVQRKKFEDLHFRDLPRFSISSRRNFSQSAAYDAFERATSTLAVTTFSWRCVFWS